jgi:hypothetical protein
VTRVVVRIFASALLTLAVSTSAWAQVELQGIGGVTSAAGRQPFWAGALGVKVTFIEIDGEVGRFQDILPKGVLDAISQLQRQRGLPVQAIASVPATYAVGSIRLISPGGPIRPFLSGGVGVARLEPQLDISVDGISLGDVFGLTAFQPQTKTMAMLAAGVRLDLGRANIEGGYRYVVIFSHYRPNANFANDSVLTYVNCLYGAVGFRF